MFGSLRWGLVWGVLGAMALGAIVAMSFDVDLPASARDDGRAGAARRLGPPCGAATSSTVAGVDESVAHRIYLAELHGREARADIAHIAGSAGLLAALRHRDRPAVYAAVRAIVYTPGWHIVRLMVVQKGQVLADVGGPDVIAPVSGALRSRGRVVGGFTMSVQDDLGYIKLIGRFTGVPIDLYRVGSLVMGTLRSPFPSARSGESLTVGESKYTTLVLRAKAFPAGALKVVLYVPASPTALARSDCESVRVAAWRNVATRVAARYKSLSVSYEGFLHTLQAVSGGLVFVRSGAARVAGVGPVRIPTEGAVDYRGRRWTVLSFASAPQDRIYFLLPAG